VCYTYRVDAEEIEGVVKMTQFIIIEFSFKKPLTKFAEVVWIDTNGVALNK
jgi:hypothetical protein